MTRWHLKEKNLEANGGDAVQTGQREATPTLESTLRPTMKPTLEVMKQIKTDKMTKVGHETR